MSNKKSSSDIKKIVTIVVALLLITLAASVFYMVVIKDDTPKTCTTYGNRLEEQCIEDYIGLSQEDAISRAKQYRYIPKVVTVDGVEQGALDVGGAVIYLEIENGKVAGGYFEEGRSAN